MAVSVKEIILQHRNSFRSSLIFFGTRFRKHDTGIKKVAKII